MRQRNTGRREIVIITSCIGVVTGTLLRLITTPNSVGAYILTAGFFIGLVTATFMVWLFLVLSQSVPDYSWPPYKQTPSRMRLMRARAVVLGLVIVASYIAIIYTITQGLYLEAIVLTLLFSLLMFLSARLALSHSPPPGENTLVYLLLTLWIAAWAGAISLIGGLFGLSLAVLVILLDPVLRILADYWLLSGIFYGAILGGLVGARCPIYY